MILRFRGHACFELQAGDGTRLCVDPYEAGGFGGAVDLPALPDDFDAWVATHGHPDHAAGHAVPSAVALQAPAAFGPFDIAAQRAWHDEFAGRLRSGPVDLLRITVDGTVVVHLGDLGERPVGAVLDWLCATPIDVLIAPVGGYFTGGPDAAVELVSMLKPRIVVPCHAAEDGVQVPQLGSRDLFLRRFDTVSRLTELRLPSEDGPSGCVLLERT